MRKILEFERFFINGQRNIQNKIKSNSHKFHDEFLNLVQEGKKTDLFTLHITRKRSINENYRRIFEDRDLFNSVKYKTCHVFIIENLMQIKNEIIGEMIEGGATSYDVRVLEENLDQIILNEAGFFKSLWKKAGDVGDWVKDKVNKAGAAISDAWDALGEMYGKLSETSQKLWIQIWDNIFVPGIESLKQFGTYVFGEDIMVQVVFTAKFTINKFDELLKKSKSIWDNIYKSIEDISNNLTKLVGEIATTLFEVGKKIFQVIKEIVKKSFNSIKNKFGDFGKVLETVDAGKLSVEFGKFVDDIKICYQKGSNMLAPVKEMATNAGKKLFGKAGDSAEGGETSTQGQGQKAAQSQEGLDEETKKAIDSRYEKLLKKWKQKKRELNRARGREGAEVEPNDDIKAKLRQKARKLVQSDKEKTTQQNEALNMRGVIFSSLLGMMKKDKNFSVEELISYSKKKQEMVFEDAQGVEKLDKDTHAKASGGVKRWIMTIVNWTLSPLSTLAENVGKIFGQGLSAIPAWVGGKLGGRFKAFTNNKFFQYAKEFDALPILFGLLLGAAVKAGLLSTLPVPEGQEPDTWWEYIRTPYDKAKKLVGHKFEELTGVDWQKAVTNMGKDLGLKTKDLAHKAKEAITKENLHSFENFNLIRESSGGFSWSEMFKSIAIQGGSAIVGLVIAFVSYAVPVIGVAMLVISMVILVATMVFHLLCETTSGKALLTGPLKGVAPLIKGTYAILHPH